MFYRHRASVEEEPLSALVHQTAMYHEDRLGHGGFARVWLCGAGPAAEEARIEISRRLGVPAAFVDVQAAAALRDRASASPDVLDPPFAAVWKAAGDDAERLRVVVDQVASLTDARAVAWHARLTGTERTLRP